MMVYQYTLTLYNLAFQGAIGLTTQKDQNSTQFWPVWMQQD